MVVIDNCENFDKKEKYIHCLKSSGLTVENAHVLTACNLSEALKIIRRHRLEECSIVINFVLIEQVLRCTDELKQFSKEFQGIIILKVKTIDEVLALNLLKEGVITEYFVDTGEEGHDCQRLEEVFKIAINKRRFNVASRKFEKSLAKLEGGIG